ncbi:succinate dehydrogenase subunit 5, mitochondrial-like isoform X2 [Aristolochia californica]|uniref:succinate dehydrogenase subunit 5, mitochondrial-like isoform X2 n=1 Tax=Aristolochia californica TaxID=171875 RepID=UPI0035DB6466
MAWRALSRNRNGLHSFYSKSTTSTALTREFTSRTNGGFKALHPYFSEFLRQFSGFASRASARYVLDCQLPSVASIRTRRLFSADVSTLPSITDPEIKAVFKDLMAASWDELPHAVIKDAEKAFSKNTEDKAGQEALKNVLRAAEAVEHFSGILVSLRMELDDSIGLSGENVGPMTKDLQDALAAAYSRYSAYLDAFGPDETYLRKKVETELGTKMIQIKLRCGGLGSEWGKVTVLGTSGLSGSYVEHRAP